MGSRFELPAEFYDRTSDVLLAQPEPQYLYAQMWLGAMRASLTTPDQLGMPVRPVGGVGAAYSSEDLSRLTLTNPMMAEVIAAKIDFNAGPGNSIRINRPQYANTTYTQASRLVTGGTSISTTAITVGSQQTSLTLYRFGGPYDSDNSRIAPYPIESFDANMGVHNISQLVGTQLKRDCHRFIDAVNVVLLDTASTAVYPDGMTAVTDATYTGHYPMTLEQVTRAEETADTANLPTFGDGYRALVLTPTQVRQLKNDPAYQRQAQVHPEYNVLFPGQYQADYGKLHIFKSTTLTTTANASSIAIHYGHLIAPGALLAGMGRPLRVVAASDDNYGETAKVIWLGDLAFGLANNTFCISVRSSA
jgi:hypothetical protein